MGYFDEKPRLHIVPPLILQAARLPRPAEIPPRRWLYGTQLIRGFVTVLVAPGGTGKSAYAMCVAASLASGQKLLGEHIFQSVNTAILNLEDPMDELERRLAAIMLRHKLEDFQLDGRLFLHSGEDRPVTMAEFSEDGFTVIYPDEEALVEQLKANQIGMVVVDPYAESHHLEENSNPQMVKAAAAWRRVARAADCAVLLIHHVRKGAATDIDAARGAKALTDSARVGLLLSSMSPEDGERLGISEEERWQYVRLDDAKVNLAPKATKARWFQLDRVDLGNGTPDYPNGDRVASIVTWEPTSAWADMPMSLCVRILDLIQEGPGKGEQYAYRGSRSSPRWAGNVVIAEIDKTPDQAAAIIQEWVRNGVLVEGTYDSPAQRKERTGLTVNQLKVAEMREGDYGRSTR